MDEQLNGKPALPNDLSNILENRRSRFERSKSNTSGMTEISINEINLNTPHDDSVPGPPKYIPKSEWQFELVRLNKLETGDNVKLGASKESRDFNQRFQTVEEKIRAVNAEDNKKNSKLKFTRLVVWLIGSGKNITLKNPYGRRFIQALLDTIVESESLLIVEGDKKFVQGMKEFLDDPRFGAMKNKMNVFCWQNNSSEETGSLISPKPHIITGTSGQNIFQCAIIVKDGSKQLGEDLKNIPGGIPDKIPEIIIKQAGKTSVTSENKNTPKKWYVDLEQKKTSFNIGQQMFDALLLVLDDGEFDSTLKRDLYLLCIHLNHLENGLTFDFNASPAAVDNTNSKEWINNAVMTAIRLYRQSFLTHMCLHGLNLTDVLKEPFIVELFSTEPWSSKIKIKKKAPGASKIGPDQKPTANFRVAEIEQHFQLELKKIIGDWFPETLKKHSKTGDPLYKMAELLFIDAILEKKLEPSIVYWTYIRHPISAALIAYGVFKNMKGSDDSSAIVLQESMITYQKLAIDAINNSYGKSKSSTFQLLVQKISEWGNARCIEIALATGNEQFLSETPAIDLCEHLWFEKPLRDKNSADPYSIKLNKKESNWKSIAPAHRFYLSFVSYLVFLGLYGVMLVSVLSTYSYHWLEWLVWAWIVTFLLQLIYMRPFSKPVKDIFDVIEVVSVVMFVLAWIFRVAGYYRSYLPALMEMSRLLFSLDYIAFSLRLFKYLYASRFLGPIVAMILGMFSTLAKFLVIILICFVAYAISSESVLYPNAQINIKLLYYVFRKAFWGMFGELFLDELEDQESSCTDDPALYNDYSGVRCPSDFGRYYVPAVLGAYILVVQILLFNLLIAMFNSTIKEKEDKSLLIWHYQKFQLTMEYSKIIFLQPPFVLISLYLIIRRCIKCFSKENQEKDTQNLDAFEKSIVEYLKRQIDDGKFFEMLGDYRQAEPSGLEGHLRRLNKFTVELNVYTKEIQNVNRGITEIMGILKNDPTIPEEFPETQAQRNPVIRDSRGNPILRKHVFQRKQTVRDLVESMTHRQTGSGYNPPPYDHQFSGGSNDSQPIVLYPVPQGAVTSRDPADVEHIKIYQTPRTNIQNKDAVPANLATVEKTLKRHDVMQSAMKDEMSELKKLLKDLKDGQDLVNAKMENLLQNQANH